MPGPDPDTELSSETVPSVRPASFEPCFNPAPERLATLIDTRRELLEGLEQHPEWATREVELSDLLRSLLNSSGLQLLRLDQHTPKAVLDQIVKYESVHRIRDSRDLERRMAEDRRCFAFFHPGLPGEPLIFTELALTRDMSSNAQALLDPESPTLDPSTCNCAIFYSINSCHEGLRGVPLGNALITQVTSQLTRELPRLDTFATLSPVPGFRSWLATLARPHAGYAAHTAAAAALACFERSDWYASRDMSAALERQLVPLCAYYLLRVKRGGNPADPVARFHLRNGARLERINWLSDTSTAGLQGSAGVMVNYVYRCRVPRCEYDVSTNTRPAPSSSQVRLLAEQASSMFCH